MTITKRKTKEKKIGTTSNSDVRCHRTFSGLQVLKMTKEISHMECKLKKNRKRKKKIII